MIPKNFITKLTFLSKGFFLKNITLHRTMQKIFYFSLICFPSYYFPSSFLPKTNFFKQEVNLLILQETSQLPYCTDLPCGIDFIWNNKNNNSFKEFFKNQFV